MKTFKKLASIILALSMVFSLATVGFAAPDETVDSKGNVDITVAEDGTITGEGNMDILGIVNPIKLIDITIPVGGVEEDEDGNISITGGPLAFIINSDRSIEWSKAEISYRSAPPMVVSMINAGVAQLSEDEVTAGFNKNGAPDLVADEKFANWDNLTKSETFGNIAISVNKKNISTVAEEPVVIGVLKSAYGVDADGNYRPNEQYLPVEGSALYGKAWDNSTNLFYKYDTILEFSVLEDSSMLQGDYVSTNTSVNAAPQGTAINYVTP